MNIITLLGLTVIFLYSLTQILKFYGIREEVYGIYVLFFVFVLVCGLILPKKENKI